MIEQFADWFSTQLQSQVFGGIAAASGFGAILVTLRRVPGQLLHLLSLQFMVEMTVLSEDRAFDILNTWLATLPYSKKTHRVRVIARSEHDDYDDSIPGTTNFQLAPGDGLHMFWLHYQLVFLYRSTSEPDKGSKRMETIRIRTFGRSQDTLRRFIAEAEASLHQRDRVRVHTTDGYHWRNNSNKLPRSLDSITLPKGQLRSMIKDMEEFISNSPWYMERGVPYRRGYLFEGPPGTGKTSTILALASYFKVPIYSLNLNGVNSDNGLTALISNVPDKAILMIEDSAMIEEGTLPQMTPADMQGLLMNNKLAMNALSALDELCFPITELPVPETNGIHGTETMHISV